MLNIAAQQTGDVVAPADALTGTAGKDDTVSPTAALANDSGSSPSDKITNDGTVNVTGLEGGAKWQYSTDNGTTWVDGSGSSVKLKGAVDGSGNTHTIFGV